MLKFKGMKNNIWVEVEKKNFKFDVDSTYLPDKPEVGSHSFFIHTAHFWRSEINIDWNTTFMYFFISGISYNIHLHVTINDI
jgi:hypothetical protein